MKDNFLAPFGFSDKEFNVYRTLVTRGPLIMGDIIDESGLHRPDAYKTVESLINKKAVHKVIVKGKKLYTAESPNTLKKVFEEVGEKVISKLGELEEMYTLPHLETRMSHYQGKKGITAMFSDLIDSQKKGDIFYRYTSEKDTEETNKLLPKDYRAIRDKKGLERFVITHGDVAKGKQNRLERATKVIPKGEVTFKHDCIQLIYANKVSFINLSKLQGVIIEDENLASFQREIFKMLYKRL
jgi:sugar-specific transcriptional regulator TrmB